MRLFNILTLLVLLSWKTSAGKVDGFFQQADAFFKRYVNSGAVAYQAVKKNAVEIEALYQRVGSMDLSTATDGEKKAFLINAYNIIVIYQVSKYYPLKSPLDQSGFFDKVKHTVAGVLMTLNTLEIKELLQTYKDARIHFALACAAKSCPPLASFAYTPEKVDQQLNERATAAVNNGEWLKTYPNQKRVELSKIFEWYKADFTSAGKTQIDWINQFRKEKIPASFSVSYYEYNWALNDK
ncbi:MAG: DUF547 domain-containing protein [Bacteroidota bacterium]